MKQLTLALTILIASGAQAAQLPHSAWLSASDDTVSCMAIGCQEGDYDRYPEYAPHEEPESHRPYPRGELIEESEPFDPTREILRRLKDEPLEPITRVEPRPIPESEDEARLEFYRALHQHADGAGTIEQVEAAYQQLVPYRR